MWLKELQIAIIEKNTENLDKLLDANPKLETTKDIKKAMYLLKEAAKLLYTLKGDTAKTIKQLRKNIHFLDSTQAPSNISLDIKS